jgi:DNA-binding phage protein
MTPRPRPPLPAALLAAVERACAERGPTAVAEAAGVSRSTLHRLRKGAPAWPATARRLAAVTGL